MTQDNIILLRNYLKIKIFFFYLGIFFFTSAFVQAFLSHQQGYAFEVFPFFHWGLFAKTPSQGKDFSLMIVEVNGLTYSKHLDIFEDDSNFASFKGIIAYQTVKNMGWAYQNQQETVFQEKKHLTDLRLLKNANQVRYQLVERLFDPIERIKNKQFKKITTLAEFEVKK